jgi:diaminohydroxyphosphoribosylaminopyrimidine deaminase/5-amino-6-(5-phosphoribosylamino)uracil reductase
MQRCLQLAENALGNTYPNPMVGCVIVCENKIIGEGYHREYGSLHAEVNAINSIKHEDKVLLSKSTVYVNLEPCAHYGKTPPCADLLIQNKVKRVVIACIDPFDKVAGKGVEKLKNAGIEVQLGVMQKEAEFLNRRFIKYHTQKKTYVILKWAESADGFIDIERNGKKGSYVLSNTQTQILNHVWRSQEQAILVGKNTVLNDNPKLTARLVQGSNPVRVVLDTHLSIPDDFNIFNDEAKTLVINSIKNETNNHIEYIKTSDWSDIFQILYNKNIQSVIVEGGARVLNNFITNNLWDEIRVIKTDVIINKGLKAPALNISADKTEIYDNNIIHYFYNKI